jgi:hypothetical protein
MLTSESTERTKTGLPRNPEYRRLLLVRGDLGETPAIYSIRWFPIYSEDREEQWTWSIDYHRGLSILTRELNRGISLQSWERLSARCLHQRGLFDSMHVERASFERYL